MSALRFLLNDSVIESDAPPGTVALDFIRRKQNLRGTKEGCREGECGACTILIGRIEGPGPADLVYRAMASCLIPLGELAGTHVITVDGLSPPLTPVQEALYGRFAAQCGFCTPGFVMSLTGFFCSALNLTVENALDAMDGNICRCTGYVPIRAAARDLIAQHGEIDVSQDRILQLVDRGILPGFCSQARERLAAWEHVEAVSSSSGPLIAGGTDLYIQNPEALEDAAEVRLIGRAAVSSEISLTEVELRLGAGTTIEQLRDSDVVARVFPSLRSDLALVASTILRNRATVVGNLVNASPIADMAIILLALEAKLEIRPKTGPTRIVPLDGFYHGYRDVDLAEDDLITTVVVPLRAKGRLFNFEKVCKRRILDIASVNSAMTLQREGDVISQAAVSAGGVAPIPLYLKECSESLVGATLSVDTVRRAAAIALEEISPISDVRGSSDYKRLLLRQLVYAHFIELFPDRVDGEALL